MRRVLAILLCLLPCAAFGQSFFTSSAPLNGGGTITGPLNLSGKFSLSTAPVGGGTTGTIISNQSAYAYPSANERSRFWSTLATVSGTATTTLENNFFNEELSPLPLVGGAFSGTVGTVTATEAAGSVTLSTPVLGSGQPNGTFPLTFAGGGCTTLPVGTVTITAGAIASTSLSNAGSGCTSNPAVQMQLAQLSVETNIVHPYGQNDSGMYFTGGEWEPLEASFLNNGIMQGSYEGLNSLYNNGPSGISSGTMMGVHLGVINGNTAVGSLAEYDGIYMQAFSGGGSAPSVYYAMKVNDTTASISTLGGVNIGSVAQNTTGGTLAIFGPDTSGGTCPLQIRNSGALMLTVCDSGTMNFASGFMTLGSGGNWGRLLFGNTTSGTLQLNAPPSGALSGTITLPNATGTLAEAITATSASIGGSALTAGACSSGTVTATNATTSMAVTASPVTYPGDGAYWLAYVSAANTVTVKVCAAVAMTPTASVYDVRVIQ